MRKLIALLVFIVYFKSVCFSQIITTVAGNHVRGYSGDGGPATAAELDSPTQLSVGNKNLYIADAFNEVVRAINTSGVISTVAGCHYGGYSGDGGPATAAELNIDYGVEVDGAGNLYITDCGNSRIRRVDTLGIITTIVGNGVAGFSGDGGAATAAEINNPTRTVIDKSGNLYIADWYNNRVRIVNTSGIISTFAGSSVAGYSGDGGPATAAELNEPRGVYCDAANNIYITDYTNSVVRKVNASGIISTFAGNGYAGFYGDGGPATAAEMYGPVGVTLDPAGNVYIGERNNNLVRMINLSGNISTVAGLAGIIGYSGDGGPATDAELNSPRNIVFDKLGDMYIADAFNNVIREIPFLGVETGISLSAQPFDLISVFPNPTSGIFTIHFAGAQNFEPENIEIFNVLGERVETQCIASLQTTINLTKQPNGIYFYRVVSESGSLVGEGKLIIQK